MSTVYETADLTELLDERMKMNKAVVHIRFTSDYVGGQPSSEAGIKAFAEHHLHLTGDALDAAVKRIMGEEVQQVSKGADEVDEKESYGLNVIRRLEGGEAWIGTWQVRAMLKQAASRLGIFSAKGKIGSKGDMSEAMIVKPSGISDVGGIQQIVIVRNGEHYTDHEYRKFMGSVNTPKGRMSIVHDSEIAPAGCEAFFTVEWPAGKVKCEDMATIIALSQRIGLGSVKAMESGRFECVKLEISGQDKAAKDA